VQPAGTCGTGTVGLAERQRGHTFDLDLQVFQRHRAAHQRLAACTHGGRQCRRLVGAVVDAAVEHRAHAHAAAAAAAVEG
jgi:hypothetical protein